MARVRAVRAVRRDPQARFSFGAAGLRRDHGAVEIHGVPSARALQAVQHRGVGDHRRGERHARPPQDAARKGSWHEGDSDISTGCIVSHCSAGVVGGAGEVRTHCRNIDRQLYRAGKRARAATRRLQGDGRNRNGPRRRRAANRPSAGCGGGLSAREGSRWCCHPGRPGALRGPPPDGDGATVGRRWSRDAAARGRAARSQRAVFERFGPDLGGDIPVATEFTRNLRLPRRLGMSLPRHTCDGLLPPGRLRAGPSFLPPPPRAEAGPAPERAPRSRRPTRIARSTPTNPASASSRWCGKTCARRRS